MHWEFGVNRCRVLYRKWIKNKVSLYSTGNYTQYAVINHNGKEYENIYVCICIIDSLCYIADINTKFVSQILQQYFLKEGSDRERRQMNRHCLSPLCPSLFPWETGAILFIHWSIFRNNLYIFLSPPTPNETTNESCFQVQIIDFPPC